MNDFSVSPILEHESCPRCEAWLKVTQEKHQGDNLPPGGFIEYIIECPNGCEQPESQVL